jgi:transposase
MLRHRCRQHSGRTPQAALEPSVQDEALRHLTRDRAELQKEVLQHRNRIGKLLRTLGCWDDLKHGLASRLARGEVRCYDGTPLSPEMHDRLLRECERVALARQQIAALEKARHQALPATVRERIDHLTRLKGVGRIGASRLVLELFWQQFDNRRQVGSCTGLVPKPYDSGDSHTDQGISKQGNRRVRSLLVEMAWYWLRYQPGSPLAQWFRRRTEGTGANRRARRIAIVAVARRLVILLWRYPRARCDPPGSTDEVVHIARHTSIAATLTNGHTG